MAKNKIKNWLHAKIIMTQRQYNFIEIFQLHILLFLVTGAIMTGLFYLILEQLNARIVLTQIWSKSIQWLLR